MDPQRCKLSTAPASKRAMTSGVRPRVCVCVCVCVCVQRSTYFILHRGRVLFLNVRERASVCVWERERVYLCVCVCVCVNQGGKKERGNEGRERGERRVKGGSV
jgi:hypothetical protein